MLGGLLPISLIWTRGGGAAAAPLPPGLGAWGLGLNSRQSRPPARGVMATTLFTWTVGKGRRKEERRHQGRREDGRGLLRVLCAGSPIPLAWPDLCPFLPQDPRAWWDMCSSASLRVCVSLGVLSMMTLVSCSWGQQSSGGDGASACADLSFFPHPASSGWCLGLRGREPDLLLHFLTIFQKENDPLFSQSDWSPFPG